MRRVLGARLKSIHRPSIAEYGNIHYSGRFLRKTHFCQDIVNEGDYIFMIYSPMFTTLNKYSEETVFEFI